MEAVVLDCGRDERQRKRCGLLMMGLLYSRDSFEARSLVYSYPERLEARGVSQLCVV